VVVVVAVNAVEARSTGSSSEWHADNDAQTRSSGPVSVNLETFDRACMVPRTRGHAPDGKAGFDGPSLPWNEAPRVELRMRSKAWRSHLSLVALGIVAGLAGTAGCRRAKEPSRGVAQIGDRTITIEEIDQQVTAELFEMRSMVLHKLIAEDLLKGEAKRRGITVGDLWNQEVDQKTALPDEAEARRAVALWVEEGRVSAEDAAQLTPDQMIQRLRRLKVREREDAYYDSLYDHAAVQVDFGALGKPWLKVAEDGPTLGPSDAKLTLVEFADLTQPFTSLWQPTLERLVAKYGGRVRFRFKQKPRRPDSPAATLAEASLCADDQHRYWEFRKALLRDKKQATGAPSEIAAAAASSKLDKAAFDACLTSGSKKALVASNLAEAQTNNLEGEPVLSVNGIRLTGAHSFSTVDRLLRIEAGKL
jgi:predicted DsbA family dithiol-disulfide isomerase